MNRGGVLESSPVCGGLMPPPPQLPPSTTTTYFFTSSTSPSSSSSSSSPFLPPTSSPNFSSWLNNGGDDLSLDQPWGGLMMGDHEIMDMIKHHNNNHYEQDQHLNYQEKKLEKWEEQAFVKQESNNNNGYDDVIINSPLYKSFATTTTTIHNNHIGLNLSKCNSSLEIGGSSFANKKLKLHQVPSSQSTLKVRKMKLGGKIPSLHQIVSPFGKTDTASVLSEAIGYIRFLHSQIEVLSVPYFGNPTRKNMMHQNVQLGDMHGIFEEPDQVLNEYCMKMSKEASSSTSNEEPNINEEETKKDLRVRGLCLVPISCTLLQVHSDNGVDY
ncbi:unnamed protein product [Cochlearia groenlandica]